VRTIVPFRHCAPVIVSLTLLACGAVDPSRNTIVKASTAPGGEMKAIVFERDCGATTDYSTEVSVMPVAKPFAIKPSLFRATRSGNVFVADTNHGQAPSAPWGGPRVELRWLDATHLWIAGDRSARVFVAAKQVSGVAVDYIDGEGRIR
jgi:hypothetical protein